MQYDELNDYMQLKRWIWNDFWTDMNQLFKKKKNKQPNQPFLKENVQQILADSTVHKPKLYMEQEVVQNPLHGIVVYFIKAMPICTVIYEFDIVSIHVFHRTD